jgi:uncharacterized membrane protein YdjX (TVP38/TMEM64 family)
MRCSSDMSLACSNEYKDSRRNRLHLRGLFLVVFQSISLVLLLFISIILYKKFDMYSTVVEPVVSFITSSNSLEKIQSLAIPWKDMVNNNPSSSILLFCLVYIILQTFAIPGTAAMNFLAGYFSKSIYIGLTSEQFAVYIPRAVLFMSCLIPCTCAAIGSSFCYLLSKSLGKSLISRIIGDRLIGTMQTKIRDHKHNLFYYFIFIRVTPILPNWGTNLASPHLNVPLKTFFWGTLIGVMPITWIQLQAGLLLEELTDSNRLDPDASQKFTLWTLPNIMFMASVAILALLPPILTWIMSKSKSSMKHSQ